MFLQLDRSESRAIMEIFESEDYYEFNYPQLEEDKTKKSKYV